MDIGLERAGFEIALCVEVDETARETLARNRPEWKLSSPGDIHALSTDAILRQAGLRAGEVDLLAAGPPCQPFSKAGYWASGTTRRLEDPRARTIDALLRVIAESVPGAILIENVPGFRLEHDDDVVKAIVEQLERLNESLGTRYAVEVFDINAADYGVPQTRERIFIAASRDGGKLALPFPTHSPVRTDNGGEQSTPYTTAWDAIGDLDDDEWPEDLHPTGKYASLIPTIPEGENYLHHTDRGGGEPLFGWRTRYWSFLLKLSKSRPAWTISASPGPSSGQFHWKSRKLSIRELCRLQTFPDAFVVSGSYSEARRQIGNAVPPAIGELLGKALLQSYLGHRVDFDLSFIPKARTDMPGPEPIEPLPEPFLELRGNHEPHPGKGKGPGARRNWSDG
jgi:DNA (cytosine-5)-methyltransferase 1